MFPGICFVRCSDGRHVAKGVASATLVLDDGREYNLVVKEFEVYFEKQDIKIMYVDTNSITVENENRTIYMESSADVGYVVFYNLVRRVNIFLADVELYTSYRYKITKSISNVVNTTVTMDGINYTLTVKFINSKEFDGDSFRTTYVKSIDVDLQNKTITVQSNDSAGKVVIFDSAAGYAFDIEGVTAKNNRFTIAKPASKEFHSTATLGGEQFSIDIYFN